MAKHKYNVYQTDHNGIALEQDTVVWGGNVIADPQINRLRDPRLSRAHLLEARAPIEQTDLLYAAEVSGMVANTGQPLNPHTIAALSRPRDGVVIQDSATPARPQTVTEMIRAAIVGAGTLRK